MSSIITNSTRIATIGVASVILSTLTACNNGLAEIDRRVDEMIRTSALQNTPQQSRPLATERSFPDVDTHNEREAAYASETLSTRDPAASDITFTQRKPIATPETDSMDLAARLESYAEVPTDAIALDLPASLQYAIDNSREHKFAEESYLLAALRLLIERHRFGPRFFDDVSATISGDADDGLYDTSLELVNEFRVSQRLPYGGEVAARALAGATEDLHQRTAGENVQSAAVILSADIPLLRGAGIVAREDLIQAERNMIYAAREYERFRREFLFSIAENFLNLVVQQRAIENAERSVRSFEMLEARARSLLDAGRERPLDVAQAEQDTLFARDSLNSQREVYRLAVDRFKVRLGMDESQALIIAPSGLSLPVPEVAMTTAVETAMSYRLDLQTRRDILDDAARGVANARNALLPDLDFSGSVTFGGDDDLDNPGFRIDNEETDFRAGLDLSIPLDRRIEEANVREAQIRLERARRSYDEFRDNIAVAVRSAVRNIDRDLYSLRIQEENVRIAERRQESIDADPDRTTAQERSDAVNGLLRAENQRDQARRDLQVSILQYLLDSGQLRVQADGSIQTLAGMTIQGPGEGP